MLDEKTFKNYLKTLVGNYLDKHGTSLSQLEVYTFFPFHDYSKSQYRAEGAKIEEPIYLREAIARGYVRDEQSGNSIHYYITAAGYQEGIKLLHPFRYLLKNYWRWLLSSALTIINLIALFLYRVFSN
ncbi:hypothetical protein K6U64_05720 [Vibrio vulnificus]|uniref:hypothetical protein n=1 Tax=Vibrio vulnificus TaxID=672 RepID=UPI001EEBC782|nr:hypothetical protein [Vibrio vulnificus]MCG6262594.1 hypothetical protein [Vibrio vulnificus]